MFNKARLYVIIFTLVVAGLFSLQQDTQTSSQVFEPVPPPTPSPTNEEKVKQAVKETDAEREQLENKSKVVSMDGLESLGADLRPVLDVVLPETVYMDGMTISHLCMRGDVECLSVKLPSYHFLSINTETRYIIDSNLKEYFSGDLSDEEKDRERQHFAGILEQMQKAIGPEPVKNMEVKTVRVDPSDWPKPPEGEELDRLMKGMPTPEPIKGSLEIIAGPATRGALLVDVLPDFKIQLPPHIESRGLLAFENCGERPCETKLPALGLKSGKHRAVIDREGTLIVREGSQQEIFEGIIIERIVGDR